MSGLLAIRATRGVLKPDVEILRALAYDNQTSNFSPGDTVTGIGVLGAGTLTGTTIADGDTVTIDGVVYTFQDTLVDAANNIHVGASDEASLLNLVNAINGAGGGTPGTDYGTATPAHPTVSAAEGTGDTLDATEREPNGATIATTADLTSGDWGAGTLAGGIAASGASGVLVEQTDGGATGELILRDVIGEFTNNERLSNGDSADGLAAGVMYVPTLTPDDSIILQADAVDMDRGEAQQMLKHLRQKIVSMNWHADNGLCALRIARGQQAADVERLGSVSFDGQSTGYTVGHVITGGTSEATGTLVEQTDGGATGELILNEIVGLFENNDALTDEGSGDGDATGAQACPTLTPDDELILQMDGVDMTKSEALELLRQIESVVHRMEWPYLAAA